MGLTVRRGVHVFGCVLGEPLRRIRVVSIVVLCVLGVADAAAADNAATTPLVRRAMNLIERYDKCDENVRVARQRRVDATTKAYVSVEERHKDWATLDAVVDAERLACGTQAMAELLQALAVVEIQAQKDSDGIQQVLLRATPADRSRLEKDAVASAELVNWARFQRLQREELQRSKVREDSCDREVKELDEFVKRDVARPSYTRESGRTYRDQASDIASFDQLRQAKLRCANDARIDQMRIQIALRSGTPGNESGGSQAVFGRELQALLQALQATSAHLNDRKALNYTDFTARMDKFRSELNAFKVRHAAFLASAPAPRLVEAGDLIVKSAATWRSSAGIQDVTKRDEILRDVAAQWLAFQKLVSEASTPTK